MRVGQILEKRFNLKLVNNYSRNLLWVQCAISSDKFVSLNLPPTRETQNTFIALLSLCLSIGNKKCHITGSCLHFGSILRCRLPWWYLVVWLNLFIVCLDIELSFLLTKEHFSVSADKRYLIKALLEWNINDLS